MSSGGSILNPLEYRGKVEPAYVRWGAYAFLLLVGLNSGIFLFFIKADYYNSFIFKLHEMNPIKKYFFAIIGNGITPVEAMRGDAFIFTAIIFCIIYFIIRVALEIIRGDTHLSKHKLLIKLIIVEIICLLPLILFHIDKSKGVMSLSVNHYDIQNLLEINFMYAAVAMIAGEIFAQALALTRARHSFKEKF